MLKRGLLHLCPIAGYAFSPSLKQLVDSIPIKILPSLRKSSHVFIVLYESNSCSASD